MAKLELGSLGVAGLAMGYGDLGAATEAAIELKELGYSAAWLSGGGRNPLGRVADLTRATPLPIATGIISIDLAPAADVAATYAAAPDRFQFP